VLHSDRQLQYIDCCKAYKHEVVILVTVCLRRRVRVTMLTCRPDHSMWRKHCKVYLKGLLVFCIQECHSLTAKKEEGLMFPGTKNMINALHRTASSLVSENADHQQIKTLFKSWQNGVTDVCTCLKNSESDCGGVR
jgi:hypothetical protein